MPYACSDARAHLRSLGMTLRKCHSERSEESVYKTSALQILRRLTAPQNDKTIDAYRPVKNGDL